MKLLKIAAFSLALVAAMPTASDAGDSAEVLSAADQRKQAKHAEKVKDNQENIDRHAQAKADWLANKAEKEAAKAATVQSKKDTAEAKMQRQAALKAQMDNKEAHAVAFADKQQEVAKKNEKKKGEAEAKQQAAKDKMNGKKEGANMDGANKDGGNKDGGNKEAAPSGY